MSKLLAANILNPIDILHLLPLMEDKKKAQVFERSLGVHPIYVPSNLGGSLTVGFGSQHKSPENALAVVDPDGNLHRADSSGKVILDIPSGNRRNNGPFLANVHAPSGRYSIYALFEDLGFAREADGSPLIPWNFWYFPYGKAMKEKTAWGSTLLSPLEKYERAFKVRGVRAWEKKHHSDPTGTKQDWEGHCHDTAPASILFRPPPEEGVTFNRVHFSCEELKFYATEFFGRYGRLAHAWALPSDGDKIRTGEFHVLRPSDEPERFGTNREVLVAFLNMLRQNVRDEGHALLMDLRDSTGESHSAVWNHAVFAYVMRFWQTQRTDLQLVEGVVGLCANEDFLEEDGSSSGLPARIGVEEGATVPVPDGTNRIQQCRFRVRFTSGGLLDPYSGDNRWWSVQAGESETYAPRYAYVVKTPSMDENPRSTANPLIQRRHVMKLLSLREKFL